MPHLLWVGVGVVATAIWGIVHFVQKRNESKGLVSWSPLAVQKLFGRLQTYRPTPGDDANKGKSLNRHAPSSGAISPWQKNA